MMGLCCEHWVRDLSAVLNFIVLGWNVAGFVRVFTRVILDTVPQVGNLKSLTQNMLQLQAMNIDVLIE